MKKRMIIQERTMAGTDNVLTIASWNCRGLKSNLDFIHHKLSLHKWDLVLLQETWLFDFEGYILDSIHSNYSGFSYSSIDSSAYSCGRPFGGTAFMWKKELSPYVQLAKNDDPRIVSLVLNLPNNKAEILNVYLPTADDVQGQSKYF